MHTSATPGPLHPAGTRRLTLPPGRAALAPVLLAAGLAALAFLPPIRQHPRLFWSLAGTAPALAAWALLLAAATHRRRASLALDVVPRAQHYVQACAHTSIFLYWGWYWPPVYEHAPLLAAQLLFAYAFDMLLGWSRRGAYVLGFGPFPIVLSTNLFLWFRDDWFYLQFLMLAAGFAGKELIRWQKDGRQTHVFNPSSFSLTVFSIALLATGTSGITWGQEIAITQFYPPQMYLFLFLVALPGQILFGVTTMTMAAVVTTYGFGLAYYGATGTYFFFDSYIPIAVFLGMHLLFTDPSTAPRTELGRLIFGALYGASTIALYALLGAAGLPTFYDKLLQVPLLNLAIRRIDRFVRAHPVRVDPARLGRALPALRRNLAYVSLWALVFAALAAAGGVGDAHRGQWIPFWQQACADGRSRACGYLAQLHATACSAGSGWSCNELGTLQGGDVDPPAARAALRHGCDLGFEPACANLAAAARGGPWQQAPPPPGDLPILLRGSKGPLTDRRPEVLSARACAQGWSYACGR